MNNHAAILLVYSILSLLCTILSVEISTAAPLRMVALDTGEGQSILLTDQQHGIVIDTGHAGTAAHVLSRIRAHGVTQLDYLILTHLHQDHASGYFRIREAFPHTPVLDPCHPIIPEEFIAQDMVRWIDDALTSDINRNCVKEGDTLSWQGHQLQVLWPHAPKGSNLNHHSLVLQLVTNTGKKLLLMGDVDTTVEQELARTMRGEWQDGGVDVFMVGHHGAVDTGNEAFLSLIKPHYTIISVNKNNLRGYPAVQTLKTLEKHSRSILRTDQHGEICIELSGQPRLCETNTR